MTDLSKHPLPALMLDSCVPLNIFKEKAAEADLDIEHVRTVWPPRQKTGREDHDPGDTLILRYAYLKKRILITRDNDHIKLSLRDKKPNHGVILILGDIGAQKQFDITVELLKKHGSLVKKGHALIYVDPTSRVDFSKFQTHLSSKYSNLELSPTEHPEIAKDPNIRVFKTPYMIKMDARLKNSQQAQKRRQQQKHSSPKKVL